MPIASAVASREEFESVDPTLGDPASKDSGISDVQATPKPRDIKPRGSLLSAFLYTLSLLILATAVFVALLFVLPNRYTDYALLNNSKQKMLEFMASPSHNSEPTLVPERIAETPSAAPVPAPVDPALLEALRALEVDIARIDNLRSQDSKVLDSLLSDNNELRTTVSQQVERIDTLKRNVAAITNQLPSLADGQSSFKKRLVSLTNMVLANEQTLASLNQQSEGRPPFMLLSIDEWGSTDSAVFELQGAIGTAIPGDILAGWRINKLAKPNCVYVSKIGPGAAGEVKLCTEL